MSSKKKQRIRDALKKQRARRIRTLSALAALDDVSPAQLRLNQLVFDTARAYTLGTTPPPPIDLVMASVAYATERRFFERYAPGWFAVYRGWACPPEKDCEACRRDFRQASHEWFRFGKVGT